MTIQVDFWNLVLLLLAFFACIGAFGKVLLVQIDRRFAAQELARVEGSKALRAAITAHDERCDKTAAEVQRVERDLMQWKADVPLNYVRREDYIRNQTILEDKMDKIYLKLDNLQLKGAGNG